MEFRNVVFVLALTLLTSVPSGECTWWKAVSHSVLALPGDAYVEVKFGKRHAYHADAFRTDSSYLFSVNFTQFLNNAVDMLQEQGGTPRSSTQFYSLDQRHQLYRQMGGILKRAGYGAGSACVERVICEVQENRAMLDKYGLVGEFLKMMFTPSLSPYAQTSLMQYLAAESKGHRQQCHLWRKKCPFSLFKLGNSFNL